MIVDYVCLKKAFPAQEIALVRTRKELHQAQSQEGLRIILMLANDSNILMDFEFSLAINIESMMEMDKPEIERYFKIMRSSSDGDLPFYCCNLEMKKFSGEGVSKFYQYPWGKKDRIILHETCPWTRIRYGNKFPFFSKRAADLHRIVFLKSSR